MKIKVNIAFSFSVKYFGAKSIFALTKFMNMKKLTFVLLLVSVGFAVNAQSPASKNSVTKVKNKVVEIACGECKFKMKGKSCDLAIRLDGKSYFVDGKSIDDFGDAHDEKHGFCNVISKANVTGEIVNGRFSAKNITLINPKK